MTQIKPPNSMEVYYQVLTYDDKTTQSLGSIYTYSIYDKALAMFEELSKASKGEYLVELEVELVENSTETKYAYAKLLGSNL